MLCEDHRTNAKPLRGRGSWGWGVGRGRWMGDGLSFPPEEEGEEADRESDRNRGDRIDIRGGERTVGDRGDVWAGVFNYG
jgi:hypothetical protein